MPSVPDRAPVSRAPRTVETEGKDLTPHSAPERELYEHGHLGKA